MCRLACSLDWCMQASLQLGLVCMQAGLQLGLVCMQASLQLGLVWSWHVSLPRLLCMRTSWLTALTCTCNCDRESLCCSVYSRRQNLTGHSHLLDLQVAYILFFRVQFALIFDGVTFITHGVWHVYIVNCQLVPITGIIALNITIFAQLNPGTVGGSVHHVGDD